MILLWTLQVLFLNNFYGAMKTSQTKMVAEQLQHSYHHKDDKAFKADVVDSSRSYDLHIFVISYYAGSAALLYAPTGTELLQEYAEPILSMYDAVDSY